MRIRPEEVASLVEARHPCPHDLLGLHSVGKGCVVRAFLRDVAICEVLDVASGRTYAMERLDEKGFFEAV